MPSRTFDSASILRETSSPVLSGESCFATAGGLGFAVFSVLAGLLASLLPARFPLLGFSWTAIHVLLMISSLARPGAALLAVRIQEPNARGVPAYFGHRGQSDRRIVITSIGGS